MNPFLSPEIILPWLWWGAILLVSAVVSLTFYGYLADRAVFEGKGRVRSENFGPVDAIIAGGLALIFALITLHSFTAPSQQGDDKLPDGGAMILGVFFSTLVFLFIMAGIIGSLLARGLSWREMFGVDQVGFAGIVLRACPLILLALPLIQVAIYLTRVFLTAGGYGEEPLQDIVRFLAAPGTGAARVVVAISAVVFAPIQEEFIFRGYIYGVVRRYAGPGVGMVVNAALFAGIHLHAPSLGGLFVLAVCLTLAYEWTGSIFVPMAMHAFFNALSVITLLGGGANS